MIALGAALGLGSCARHTSSVSGPSSQPVADCGSPYFPFPTFHDAPAWSVAGQIAYRSNGVACVYGAGAYGSNPDSAGIWVLDLATRVTRRILDRDAFSPSWSPDGASLAFERAAQISTAHSDGSSAVVIVPAGASFSPAWSPDGQLIAYNSTEGDRTHFAVWVTTPDGSMRRRIIEDGRDVAWSPSGDKLVFVARVIVGGTTVGSAIRECRLSDSTITSLFGIPSDALYSPAYSPDGTHIAFAMNQSLPCEPTQIWLMDADGTHAAQLTVAGGAHPRWSPDGTRIINVRENPFDTTGVSGVLWIRTPGTVQEEQVTHQSDWHCQ